MLPNNFFNKYNGKYIDFDGHWGCQCVDLMRQYWFEALKISGYTIPPVTYAKEIFTRFPNIGTKNFRKVFNGPINAPKMGDIVIWGYYPTVTGWAGHVAICNTADSMNLITFDQNYGTPKTCRFVKHSYKGVLGWLSPK